MEFELTREVLDQIIFAMEDQTVPSVVDRSTGEVRERRPEEEAPPEDRWVPVPEWKPVDGYRLMERFVTGLRNPGLREELRAALSAGRGVFRSFKDALRRHPEIEKRWFLFKEREMRRVVGEWYNQLRELAGLERLGLEPTDDGELSEELIEADFLFSIGVGDRAAELAAADRRAFGEVYAALDGELVEELYRRRAATYPAMDHAESAVVVAEDQGGQLAGFAWGAWHPTRLAPGESWKLVQLTVTPAYRGIGLAGTLVRRFLETTADRGAAAVYVELGGTALGLRGLFGLHGFAPAAEILRLDMEAWTDRGSRPR